MEGPLVAKPRVLRNNQIFYSPVCLLIPYFRTPQVTDKQVRCCWYAKRKHKAQLTNGHGVHYPCITSPLWSTQQNVRFQGPERLNRHRPRKALIGHTYHTTHNSPAAVAFVAGRMGQAGDKAARTLKRQSALLTSCCIDTVL